MAEWGVDPLNPGEILACCGIAHLAWLHERSAVTGFDDAEGRWRFTAPDGVLDNLDIGEPVKTDTGLKLGDLEVDWWKLWGLNPELKTWAGQQSAFSVHTNLIRAASGFAPTDWQSAEASTTGRLNLDIHGTWNALSLGWSLNEHAELTMLCRPWLELLASIGLQAFPVVGSKRDGFHYYTWISAPLPAAVAAFQGHGPGVYALAGYRAATDKSGSNTILLRATPLQ